MAFDPAVLTEAAPSTRYRHSKGLARILDEAKSVSPSLRQGILRSLPQDDFRGLLDVSEEHLGTRYGLWEDDPVGFVTDILGETLWSRQKEVLRAVAANRRVAVPSCFASGKTHLSGRIAVWYGSVHPPGTALVVTTAPYIRQVHRQVWPHIRKVRAKAQLPGEVGAMQWKVPDSNGVWTVVAYGVGAPAHDPESLQGIHAARMLLVVDEAGNISQPVGTSIRALLTGEHTRMLAIGNPPMSDPGSWFETLCSTDGVTTIPITTYDTPNFTGEHADRCKDCPPEVPAHPLAEHLVDAEWLEDTLAEHGEGSAFVESKVWARFPHTSSNKIIPPDWVMLAAEAAEAHNPVPGVFPPSLDADGNAYHLQPRPGPIVLGVDVAADGGDEFAIARREGDLVRIVHSQAGAANANAVDVAGVVLRQILQAELLRGRWQQRDRVVVRIDAIGVGWGVASVLEAWHSEGMHSAKVERVVVSEGPSQKGDPRSLWQPHNKRAEMWVAGRTALTPGEDGLPAVRLDIDKRTMTQLSEPTWHTSTGGKVLVETKEAMRKRGVRSPDRAEAVLLSLFESARRPVRVRA